MVTRVYYFSSHLPFLSILYLWQEVTSKTTLGVAKSGYDFHHSAIANKKSITV
jgi:hypothetical protein